MRCIINTALYLSSIFFSIACGHGFGPSTFVQLADRSQDTIYSVCVRALHKPTSVASYDISHACTVDQPVVIGKRSTTNCYIELGFDSSFHDAHDIVCTPTQEFYVPAINQWVPAYLLQTGDALLTKKMTSKLITHKIFVPKKLNIYMLEVATSHTFFVGKHAILTHNIFLPVAMSLGLVVPFGGVATGAVGSFFGPIGLVGGAVFGGVVGVVIKAFCKNRISRYETPVFNIAYIHNSCHNIALNKDDRPATPPGCFTIQNPIDTACIYPIENPLPQIQTGCVEIEISVSSDLITNSCRKNPDQEKAHNGGCFQPNPHNQQDSGYSQDKNAEPKDKGRYSGPTARNWKEFEQNCPIGQIYGKNFVHTGKQNPKDGAPIRKLAEDIPNTEMFKRGHFYALDRFHDGDHFEVWDRKGNWVGVANLDGSENHAKTNAETDKQGRNIKRII